MLRSFYIASSGMLAQREKMGVLTNNMTNIDTAGYKKDTVVSRCFQDLLIQSTKSSKPKRAHPIGHQNTGIHADQVVTVFSQGGLEETSRMTDVALEGEGFFVIDTPQGARYTRDGSFSVARGGYLTTADGHFVSGVNGSIYVGDGAFTIDIQGNVTIDGVSASRLKIVTFDDLSTLRKTGDNMYAATQAASEATEVKARQGYLENSNVNMADEIVSLVEYGRHFELNQRILKMIDESLSKTVNEVGRI